MFVMRSSLKVLLILFGGVCVAIAAAHIALGPRAIVGGVPVNATMDGEDRFFATLFMGFGVGLIWCARELEARRTMLNGLLLFFWLGGFARALSWATVGTPHPLFQVLTAVELLLPLLIWGWLARASAETLQR
jgi:hypothetical protein